MDDRRDRSNDDSGSSAYPSFTSIDFPIELSTAWHGDHWIVRAGNLELRLTNLTRVYWDETGYTKGDLLTYYYNVAPYLLPHLRDRPLTLRRQPEGIAGPYWYEKDVPRYRPDWLSTLAIRTETGDRTIEFASISDLASLLWIVNTGCIELHPHHTRGAQQQRPSYAVIDLDPFHPASFDEARYAASLVKVILDRLELKSYPKTSGGAGIHIYLPLDGRHTYQEVRAVVARICSLVHSAEPEVTTTEWDTRKRAGKVFLDANMNRAGASLAAPYSVRARWCAPVSMPLTWPALETVDPDQFDMRAALHRVTSEGDVFAPVSDSSGGQSLASTIDALDV